ncbi:PKD domain-containing protein, partial [Paraherbaspirillum soli]
VKREQIVTVKAPAVPQNEKPVAHLTGPAQAEAESLVTLDASASSDPDGDALNYVWQAPQGIKLTSDGARASFTAPALTVDQPFTFTVGVQDGKETVSAQHTVLVKAPVVVLPLEAVLDVPATVQAGGKIDFKVDVRQSSGKPLKYQWSRTASLFSGSVGNKPSGSYAVAAVGKDSNGSISVIVSDGTEQLELKQAVTVQAPKPNLAPDGALNGPASVKAGQAFQLDAAFSDPENDQLSYRWTIPSGFTGSSADSAALRLTAPVVKTDTSGTVTVEVSDGKNQVAKSFNVKVVAPTCTATPWQAGKAYNGNATVQHQGKLYRARWWNQGNEPGNSANTGADGSGKVWADLGAC